MDSKQKSESSKHSTILLEADPLLIPDKESKSLSSSSSSSSSSSDFPLDEVLSTRDENVLISHNADAPTSPSALTVEYSLTEIPEDQSFPLQVTDKEEKPTPYRIPSKVFARTPSSKPVEWSVTSNESLFSIHMGNNSFSADQIFLMRSGELGMPGDYNNFLDSKLADSNNRLSTTSPRAGNENIGVDEAAAETMKEVIRATSEDKDKEKTPTEAVCHSSSVSRRSDESGTSVVSFAFPILTGEASRAVSAKVEPEHPVQLSTEPPKEQSMEQPKEKSQEQQQEQHQQQQPSSPAPQSAAPPAAQTKWFPCLPCSFCC